jgi:hypothetical protein
MNLNRKTIFAWVLFTLITTSVIVGEILYVKKLPPGGKFSPFEVAFALIPVMFALMGVLIVSRQPRNVIGLLMMLPGLSFAILVDAFMQPYIYGNVPAPDSPSFLFFLIVWFSNWNWILLIFPILFIMILFPTGRPLSPRWRWLVVFGLFIPLLMIFLGTFAETLTPSGAELSWAVENPIGFIPASIWDSYIGAIFTVSLPVFILLSVVSVFIRFRRARGVEREQIKWLFYGGAMFALFYLPSFFWNSYTQVDSLFNLLFVVGLLIFPVAIAIAILRYRLYDIDVIIRRTVQYAILTGLLALVYFASVVLLQNFFENLTGLQSQVAIVISTLILAVLFNPLRTRVQRFIDRRLFRKKYDAERTLTQFAVVARDVVDLDHLESALLGVVEETLQPEGVVLWLKR